ncbi:MAG: RodZ domain-containing protein [Vicinamibacterales bacterium]
MSQGSPARTVGARLREAREKRGVSLRQIATSTRISVMSLEALERSDLSRLPGGIFTRAFIRAYAQEVGLDPDRTIQDFIAELPPEAATATVHSAGIEDGEKLESDRRAVATALRLVLVSLPIIGFVIYYGTHRRPAMSAGVAAPAAESHASATDTPAVAHPPPERVAAAPSVVPQASGLSMEISPRARCWVSVNADGELVFSGLVNAGDKRVVKAREHIVLNVGDAGAFAYTLNGRRGKALGGPGEVVSTRITLNNLQDFLTP